MDGPDGCEQADGAVPHDQKVAAGSQAGAGRTVAENEARRGQSGAGGPARGSAVCALRR